MPAVSITALNVHSEYGILNVDDEAKLGNNSSYLKLDTHEDDENSLNEEDTRANGINKVLYKPLADEIVWGK